MRRLSIFAACFMLFYCTAYCLASSKQMNKAVSALAALEKNPGATLAEHKQVVEMFNKILMNSTKEAGEAYFYLGESYSIHVPKKLRNDVKAGEYYKKAYDLLENNSPLKNKAIYNVGLYYYYKNTENQDLAIAHELMLRAAEADGTLAGVAGEMYEFGVGCDINPTLALAYYQRANEAGIDNYSRYYSVDYFVNQIVGNRLDTIAFSLYKKSILHRSMGVNPNLQDYLPWLTEAAERGYIPAQFELGSNYMLGELSAGSKAETQQMAEKWLKKAAEADFIPAIHQLGVFYEQISKDNMGRVSPEGFTKAYPYYEKAAERGFPPSQCAMAFYDYNGLAGLPVDQEAGEVWLQKSSIQGYKRAIDLLNQLKQYQQMVAREKRRERIESIQRIAESVSQALADISAKQQKMTDTQQNTMNSVGYGHGKKASGNTSSGNTSSTDTSSPNKKRPSTSDCVNRNTDQNTYEKWASQLMDMYYGHSTYSDSNRKTAQDAMKRIREKWEAKDMWIGGKSSWETWNGVCKYYKK